MEGMDDIYSDLTEKCKQLYEAKKFSVVQDMWDTFLKELGPSGDSGLRARALNNRGHARYMQVQFDKATEDFDEAVGLMPDFAEAHYNRATVAYRMGKYAVAVKDFEAAAAMQPDNPEFKEGFENCKAQL